MMKRVRRVFLAGLFLIVPLAISLWVIFGIAVFLDGLLGHILERLLKGAYVPGMGVIGLVLLVFVVGVVCDNLIGKKLYSFFDGLLERIPLFNKLYTTVREISNTLFGRTKQKLFQQAVLVPFPAAGVETIGFVVPIPDEVGADKIGVFVPTPPNIANGFYLIYPREQVRPLDMSVEDAVKTVISVGTAAKRAEDEPGRTAEHTDH